MYAYLLIRSNCHHRTSILIYAVFQMYFFSLWEDWFLVYVYTSCRRQSKTLFTIDERSSKPLEAVFSIAICRQSGDKWQSKTMFLTTIFDLRSAIVLTFSIAAYSVWCMPYFWLRRKNTILLHENYKGSLISSFGIHHLEIIISKLAAGIISTF